MKILFLDLKLQNESIKNEAESLIYDRFHQLRHGEYRVDSEHAQEDQPVSHHIVS